VLKAECGYRGYWLYLPLFTATACGLGAGAVRAFAKVESLREIAPRVSGRLAAVAAGGFAVFAAAATWMLLRSNLVLFSSTGVTP
jgi:hypothetical protein